MKIFPSILFILFLAGCSEKARPERSIAKGLPEDLYGELFYDVQSKEIFSDSKTFVDCIPIGNLDFILSEYALLKIKTPETIADFVKKNFKIPLQNSFVPDSSTISEHITSLWKTLKRPADKDIPGTLITLPNSYLVPGGRFREVYYWDSYFTMLGLQADGDIQTIQQMIDNFSWLINQYGFIPNGNRTYYLSRSQPPFFALMVSLLAENKGYSIYENYLPALEKEYAFWMKGINQLKDSLKAINHVVKLPGGEILNRYWDEKTTPRAESYREDIQTVKEALKLKKSNKEDLYRNIRAAAESGWDFSSRWLNVTGPNTFALSTIHTTDIIPVDLNCLLYYLERSLAHAYTLSGNKIKEKDFIEKSARRSAAINKYCWDTGKNYFMDFDFKKKEQTSVLSLAGVFPLFFQIASPEQAREVEQKLKEIFLRQGGLVTTPYKTGQQWDAPNGWAPLQWIAIKGLRNYNLNSTADTIKNRWLSLGNKIYKSTYKLLEKYNVEDLSKKSGGGEYPTQDGFGWTNGVYQKLYKEKN